MMIASQLPKTCRAFAASRHHLCFSKRPMQVKVKAIEKQGCFPSLRSHTTLQASPSNLSPTTDSPVVLYIPSVEDMEDLGSLLATLVLEKDQETSDEPVSDLILLDGDLGAGKTCISRGFIQTALGDFDMVVTSPTYLLSNTYKVHGSNTEIQHMDLYRLTGKRPNELRPLNLEYVFEKCVALIEWPERLGQETKLPSNRLEVCLRITPENDRGQLSTKGNSDEEGDSEQLRQVMLTPFGDIWMNKLKTAIETGFLDDLLEPPPLSDY